MKKEFPTVEELVAIFKSRGWRPVNKNPRIFMGAEKEAVEQGQCCIIPALLVYEGIFDDIYEDPDFEKANPYYATEEKYGKDVWAGFDGLGKMTSSEKVYQLSKNLRKELEKIS